METCNRISGGHELWTVFPGAVCNIYLYIQKLWEGCLYVRNFRSANRGNIIGDILVVNGYLYVWGTVKDVALVTVGANAAASVAVFAVLWITDRDKVMQKPKQWDLKEILRLGIPAAMFAKNANLTFGNSLRAAGDVVYPVVISVMSMWGIGTGLAWVLGCVLDFGLVGIFAAFLIDETLRSFLLWHRWNRRVEGKLRL